MGTLSIQSNYKSVEFSQQTDTVSISRASSNLYQHQPTFNNTTTYHTLNNILQLLSDKLMEYQAKRGGKVVFQDIAKPTTMEWGSPLDAMQAALELEKTVNESL